VAETIIIPDALALGVITQALEQVMTQSRSISNLQPVIRTPFRTRGARNATTPFSFIGRRMGEAFI
jgi:hypothetical protein